MRREALLVLTLMMAAPLIAAPPKVASKPALASPPEAKLIQSCEAHKFEAVVEASDDDGQQHKSKVRLCGVEGQSDAEWIGTLRDAVRKLDADTEMPAAKRNQIVAAIKAEIARLSIVGTPVPPKRGAQGESAPPLSRDYAALPPLPPPRPPEAPAPVTAAPVVVTEAPTTPPPAVAPAATLAMPGLKITCETPSDSAGPAPCAEFQRETRLSISADGEVPEGAVLQFVRNGRAHGELSLAGLGKGGVLRGGLPSSVCAGFGAGRLELQILENGAMVRSEGPYSLRCN